MRYSIPFLLFAALPATFVACGDDESPTTTSCEGDVSRASVLSSTAMDIDRELSRFVLASGQLSRTIDEFAANPNDASLDIARDALLSARLAYATAAPYALVVDENEQTLHPLAAFPVDTTSVVAFLRDGSFDAGTTPDFDRGFAAMEYLLYSAPNETITARFRSSPAHRTLLAAYAADVTARAEEAETTWATERDIFIAASGSAAGSGFSRLVNSLSKHYEDTRRDRLGIPFGVTLGFPSPQALEAPYSNHSIYLLRQNVAASSDAYAGHTGDRTDSNIDDYLEGLGQGEPTELAADITARYTEAVAALEALPEDLATAFESDRDAVQTAYNAMSRQVVNLKTDLPSVTCVAITYVDNPSDSD